MKYTINRWRITFIIFVVALLSLSALPTFFGKQDAILLKPNEDQSTQLTIKEIKSLVTKNNKRIRQINKNGNDFILVLSKGASYEKTITSLRNEPLLDNYDISLSDISAAPAFLTKLGFEPIELGLDLYGGVLLLINVDSETALNENTQAKLLEMEAFIQSSRLYGVKLSLTKTSDIKVVLDHSAIKSNKVEKLKDYIQINYPSLTINTISNKELLIAWKDTSVEQFKNELLQQSVSIMRKRVESLGITEASIQRQGAQEIRIELPGLKNPEQAVELIGTTASLDIYAYDHRNTSTLHFSDNSGNKIRVLFPAIFDGTNIKMATAGIDERGVPLVNLVLDNAGGQKMSQFSKYNVGKAMVTVFSEYQAQKDKATIKSSEVINVATLVTHLGNRFSITNLATQEQAQSLAMLIRAGSLNAPLTILEKRSIDPSLGKENVTNGFAALALGLGFTILFMAIYYRRLGVVANIALVVNLLCLLGLMALIPGVVLTLPGIAGLVLTVGMAVDTNVLIFERIKEERKKTKQLLNAIHISYEKAFTAIIDANLTTMICALILLSIGNGPVKGFAITLCLGILTSLFTGVLISKMLTQLFYLNGIPKERVA